MATSQEGHPHIVNRLDDLDDIDCNVPSGQQSQEAKNTGNKTEADTVIAVMNELIEVKQELTKVNAELLIYRDKTEDQESRIKEQERKNTELMRQLEGLVAEVRSKESNQKPDMKVVRVDTAVEFSQDEVASPKVDKKGIVRGGQEVYSFNESVWDSLIFLGHIQGSYEGVDMIILGFLNLVIQIFFCALLITLDLAGTGAEVYTDAVNAFIQWRIGVAHQAEHYDPLTNSSLAQRVCLQYGGTIESRRHQNDLAVASSYYDVRELSEFQGPGLLMLALALWMALILKEVVSILGFTRMLAALVLNGTGKTELVKNDLHDDELEIKSMSKTRAWLIFFTVVVPRLFISMMLGYVGIFYLRQTFSVEEIILNAMALGFVLEIDELLFSFLPAAARYAVSHIKHVPLEIKDVDHKLTSHRPGASSIRKLIGIIFERTRILLVILVVVVIYFRFTIIATIQDSMEISQLILCDGNRQFIFKESRATNVLHLAQTVDMSGEDEMNLPLDEIQDVFDAILQATNLCHVLDGKKDLQDRLELCDSKNKDPGMWCARCPHLLSLSPDAHLWKADSLEDTITLVTATRNEALSSLECTDRYTTLNETFIPAPMNELLRGVGANFSAALCEDMKQYCLHPDIQIREVVRIFCPSQCQCNHGTSATVEKWFFDRTGCVPTCQGLVNSELAQLEEDLVLGKETCTDRDHGLSEAQWRSYVEDVQQEFVKRGWLYAEGGVYYASEAIAGFFAVKTAKDMTDFTNAVLHTSNTIRIEGCTLPRVPIDLVAWVRTAGSLCRWVRIVQYVFGFNLCSHTILLADGFYGFNALSGLCPLSCGVWSCSQIQPQGDLDSNLNAWYNVVPWGQDSAYNFNCDREDLLCVEVEKWSKVNELWPPHWEITITEDAENATVVYAAGMEVPFDEPRYEKDVACMRPKATNSSCYLFETQMKGYDWYYTGGFLWRLTEVGTGQILLVGSHSERHRACGLDWLSDLGVQCKHGDTVSVMTSWHQMRVDNEVIKVGDPSYEPLEYTLEAIEKGMFGFRKALLQGGYDGNSVQVLYSEDVMGGIQAVPFHSVALPLLPKPNGDYAGQQFAGCLPSSELSTLRQDKILCADGNVPAILCSQFVEQVVCETSIGFMRELFVMNGCESDLDGYTDDDAVAHLCPEACAAQAACPNSEEVLGSSFLYLNYYTFELAGCLHSDCRCLPPVSESTPSILTTCWSELNLSRNWAEESYIDYYYMRLIHSTTTTTTIPDYEREIIGKVVKEGIYCASEEAGFRRRNFHVTNISNWCYVKSSCLGSKPSKQPGTCSWRPALQKECDLDYSDPEFCIPGCGPHNCYYCGTTASHVGSYGGHGITTHALVSTTPYGFR